MLKKFHFGLHHLTQTGYTESSRLVSWTINYSLTLVIFTLALPVFLVLPILIKLEDGGPVFYKGKRLGKRKKIFYMYKFRTLVPNAEQILGNSLLKPQHQLETKLGRYLRETRLDELPQLINVLKGEMDLVGPRPERQSVYEKHCKNISGYDHRFEVKPGLIGHSQLFTPHSTPKRIRAFIDNYYIRRKQILYTDAFFFLLTLLLLIIKGIKVTFTTVIDFLKYFLREDKYHAKERKYSRLTNDRTIIGVFSDDDAVMKENSTIKLADINDECLTFFLTYPIKVDDGYQLYFKLKVENRSIFFSKPKIKTIYCSGIIYRINDINNKDKNLYQHIIQYKPVSAFNRYLLHKYLLNKSIF